jgi:hypothetical protein
LTVWPLAASGGRFIVSNDHPVITTCALAPIAAAQCPAYEMSCTPSYSGWVLAVLNFFGGVSEYDYAMTTKPFPFDNARSKATLGLAYRPMEATVKECALSMVEGPGEIKGRRKKEPPAPSPPPERPRTPPPPYPIPDTVPCA